MQVAQSLPLYIAPSATFGARPLPTPERVALVRELTLATSPASDRLRAGLMVALGACAGLAAFALGVALSLI